MYRKEPVDGAADARLEVLQDGMAASWRDYDGEDIFGDYTVDPATGTSTGGRSYQSGLGFADPGVGPQYLHGDQIGTLRAVTDGAGAAAARPTWTAFGEPVENGMPATPSTRTRYGYAGSWGYEEAECRVIDLNGPEPGGETTWCDPLAELGWLHVGHRYYDPTSGRFVQRDPIGIAGGLNTYAYVLNDPLSGVDPGGLYFGWWLGDEETGNFWVDLTGGRDSWFDDHRKVRHAQKTLLGVAAGCISAATGLYAFNIDVAFALFPSGGGGVTIVNATTGRAVLSRFPTGFHINPFKWRGIHKLRPHFHRGLTKSQWGKHRPWQGW